jgi:hypothetical protein
MWVLALGKKEAGGQQAHDGHRAGAGFTASSRTHRCGVEIVAGAGPPRPLRAVRWLAVALWIVPFLGAVANALVNESGGFDPVWNGRLAYVTPFALAVFAGLIVLLLSESGQAWALPRDSAVPSPWDALRRTRDHPTTGG